MRLWSLHPKYLDSKGLVALWREGLLAKKVLEGKTRGYRNHPQLVRFRETTDPVVVINWYLHGVVEEAERRGFKFDRKKLRDKLPGKRVTISQGQLGYEMVHLVRKMKTRDQERWVKLRRISKVEPHPVFRVVTGGVAEWERFKIRQKASPRS